VYVDHRAWPDQDRLSRPRAPGEASERSRREAVRRARSKVRRLARFGGYRWMVTLTFPGGGVHFLEDARHQLTSWLHGKHHRGGAAQLFGGAYIAIPERHPGGHGWHWHILTNRRPVAQLVQASWSRHLGSSKHVRVHHKHWSDPKAAASYAAKYVAKAMEPGALGRHRYHVGESVEVPAPAYELILAGDVYEAIWKVLPAAADGIARVCKVDTGAGPPAAWAGW
jgi:hypothetical protein